MYCNPKLYTICFFCHCLMQAKVIWRKVINKITIKEISLILYLSKPFKICVFLIFQRKTKCLEPEGILDPGSNVAKTLKNGNKGIITTNFDAKNKKTTSQMAAYSRPKYPLIRTKGVRSQFIEETFSSRIRLLFF